MPDESYDVGYGKPPIHSRFQKGRSGNPRGRPRKSTDYDDLMEAELRRRVPIRENGKSKKITVGEVIVKRQVSKAVDGDRHALDEVTAFMRDHARPDDFQFDPEDEKALADHRDRNHKKENLDE